MSGIGRYAKALIGLLGAVATWALATYPGDPQVAQWAGLGSALATALAVFVVPNAKLSEEIAAVKTLGVALTGPTSPDEIKALVAEIEDKLGKKINLTPAAAGTPTVTFPSSGPFAEPQVTVPIPVAPTDPPAVAEAPALPDDVPPPTVGTLT